MEEHRKNTSPEGVPSVVADRGGENWGGDATRWIGGWTKGPKPSGASCCGSRRPNRPRAHWSHPVAALPAASLAAFSPQRRRWYSQGGRSLGQESELLIQPIFSEPPTLALVGAGHRGLS